MPTTTNLPEIGADLESFSITLEVPGPDPTTLEGGTGSVRLNSGPINYPETLIDTRFSLDDTDAGTFVCRVSELNWGFDTSVSAETMLHRLAVVKTIRPMQADMDAGMNSILDLVGMVSQGLPATSTTFPGWNGPLWDYLKLFCAVHNYEMIPHATGPSSVVFRGIRSSTFGDYLADKTFTLNNQTQAQNVEVTDYGYGVMSGSNIELTPALSPDAQVLSVSPGETAEFEIRVDGWVATVNQPAVLDFVGSGERTDGGAYCVAGSDGLPITAAQWTATGGSVKVQLTEDPSVIKVIVNSSAHFSLKGPNGEDRFAPYSIAATSGDGTLYNSLHITGTGVRHNKKTVRIPTGVSEGEELGATVDNPWVTGVDKTYTIGSRAAQAYAGPSYTMSLETAPRSALRSVVGSRFDGKEVKFRITNVTFSESSLTASGSMDTLISDFNSSASGMTFSQWATAVGAITFNKWSVTPLKVS